MSYGKVTKVHVEPAFVHVLKVSEYALQMNTSLFYKPRREDLRTEYLCEVLFSQMCAPTETFVIFSQGFLCLI